MNTGGGAYIGGTVKVGGDFAGRDHFSVIGDGTVVTSNEGILARNLNILVSESSASFVPLLKSAISEESLKQATETYLRYIIERYRYLDLKGMGVAERTPLRLPLLDLYVPLKARLQLPEGEAAKEHHYLAGRPLAGDGARAGAGLSEPQPLLKLLQDNSGLVVLGDPGAGKTTFLKFLALKLALGAGEGLGLAHRLPILVPISAYATRLSQQELRFDHFIAGYFRDRGLDLPIQQLLQEALTKGAAVVLLDGLDEVKDVGFRHRVVKRVEDFYAIHRPAGNKFVITSRIVGYRDARPAGESLAECTLVDFTDEEIGSFVGRWTLALEQQAQGDTSIARSDAQHERQELLDAVRHNPGVRHLAANPLLLTVLALMKRQGVRLPERRVQLYHKYVEVLLSSWNLARSLDGPPSREVDVGQTLRILAPIALWMHETSPGVGLVKREALREKLGSIYEERGEPDPAAARDRFMDDVHKGAGLLLERGSGEYGFIHLTFEEFLAAVAVVQRGQQDIRPIVEFLRGCVDQPVWREVVLLAVGYLGLVQQRDEAAGAVVEALAVSDKGEQGAVAVLAGDAVVDAWPGGVPVSSKQKVIDALVPVMQSESVQPPLRRQAGLILGRLGWLPSDLEAFVGIREGPFLYGDEKERREISKPYRIGKYPVTNAQYASFVEAKSYHEKRWWSELGWSWRIGTYDSKAPDWIKDWLRQRPPERRAEPFFWRDPELANPLFPVVGVSWFEAEAFCHWLTERLREAGDIGAFDAVRLPTELEWERAARGTDGREYPWGKEFNRAFANTSESNLERTTPVCTYPQGKEPEGPWDMAGNVWEWTASAWSQEELDVRVLRGGSWIFDRGVARCACRGRLIPGNFGNSLGFRVVLSLANSES